MSKYQTDPSLSNDCCPNVKGFGSSVVDSVLSGTLRNVSSAGEPARVFMRSCLGLVDTLIWSLKAAVQQRQAADEKVRGREEGVCVGGRWECV